jgi:hypothetical protein
LFQVERVSTQLQALLTLQPQDGQFMIAQHDSLLFTDILERVTQIGHFPMKNLDQVSKYQAVMESSIHMRLLFAIYVTSIVPGGNVYQIANFVWSRMVSDELSTELGWALADDDSQDSEATNPKQKRAGHKGKQKLYTALRSFARDVTFLMFLVIRRRCTMSARKVPSTFLIIEAIREARKQATTRWKRKKEDGGPIVEEMFMDETSPTANYVTAGDMDDDLAQTPDVLFENHVSNHQFNSF